MPKRHRLRATVSVLPAIPEIHDRRVAELPPGAIIGARIVPDPYDREKRLVVSANLRDDPLALMFARKQITKWERGERVVDPAKYEAGREWQRLYEASEIGGIRAIDTTREPVDGGGNSFEMLTERSRRARKRLMECARVLGLEGEALLRDVLGRGMFLVQVASARELYARREIEYLGQRFNECLETLAKEFGYA